MYYSTYYETPIGRVMLGSDGKNLIGLWNDGQKYFGGTVSEKMIEKQDLEIFDLTKKWLNRYFEGKKPNIDELPLAPIGGEFRQIIWNVLCDIPCGEVITYGEIAEITAKIMGKEKMSSRAVGGAVGHNPISIIIPCHRVIGAGGKITGYAGGIEKKIELLKHENVDVKKLSGF